MLLLWEKTIWSHGPIINSAGFKKPLQARLNLTMRSAAVTRDNCL